MAKKAPVKKGKPPVKKKTPPKSLEKDDEKEAFKGFQIDFKKQRFCSKCGKVIEISSKNCNLCNADLSKIKAIGETDEILKQMAISALSDPESKVRKEAVDDLGSFKELKVLGVLTYVLLNDPDEDVRKEAADEIGDIHHEYSIESLTKALKDKSIKVRKEALEGLKKIKKGLGIEEKEEVIIKEPVRKKPASSAKRPKVPITRPALGRKPAKKRDVIGSITVMERFKNNIPWILGKKIRKPKIRFPKIKRRRISIPLPSKTVAIIIIFIMLFILQTGVIYIIYKEPPALGADSNGEPIFIYPSIHDSFIIEGIVASILIFVCSMGYILLYQASKHVYNRKIALRILIFGLAMIFFAFVSLQYMIAVKTGNAPNW